MPNTTQYKSIIEMYRNCPFGVDGNHTLEPMDISNKVAWLEQQCEYNSADDRYEKLMYVRADSATNRGTFRLECLDIWAFSYNYCYINNLRGESYFAYITGCRYINDASQPPAIQAKGVYEFDFVLDLLMTNLHGTDQLKPCYVIRQHSETDDIGDNLVYESQNVGEEYNNTNDIHYQLGGNYHPALDTSTGFVVVALIPNKEDGAWLRDSDLNTTPVLMDNVPTACDMWVFPLTVQSGQGQTAGMTGMKNIINKLKSYEQVVNIYIVPNCAVKETIPSGGKQITETWPTSMFDSFTYPRIADTDTLDGYLPKNKKMYTYPYSYLKVYNDRGESVSFRYELFAEAGQIFGGGLQFELMSTISAPVEVILAPVGYNNIGGLIPNSSVIYQTDPSHCISIGNYPLGSWRGDAFQNWVSKQGLPSLLNAIGTIGGVAAGTAIGGAAGAVVGGQAAASAISALTHLSTGAMVARQSDKFIGNRESGNAEWLNRQKAFRFCRVSPLKDDAKRIDDYFTRFGYAQERLMQPNPNARPYWTFLQTGEPCYTNVHGSSGATQGSANAKQITEINAMLMRGVTFWDRQTTKDNIFKYDTLDNSPST